MPGTNLILFMKTTTDPRERLLLVASSQYFRPVKQTRKSPPFQHPSGSWPVGAVYVTDTHQPRDQGTDHWVGHTRLRSIGYGNFPYNRKNKRRTEKKNKKRHDCTERGPRRCNSLLPKLEVGMRGCIVNLQTLMAPKGKTLGVGGEKPFFCSVIAGFKVHNRDGMCDSSRGAWAPGMSIIGPRETHDYRNYNL